LNDAAAIAAADVGVAVGTGTDVAIAAADVTLMGGAVTSIADALELARRTYRVIAQNLFWAFGYNVVMIPVAIAGLLSPAWAAAAMASSSVSVILNALRLRRFRRGGPPFAQRSAKSTAGNSHEPGRVVSLESVAQTDRGPAFGS
jgi:Cu+-exporting ATPase